MSAARAVLLASAAARPTPAAPPRMVRRVSVVIASAFLSVVEDGWGRGGGLALGEAQPRRRVEPVRVGGVPAEGDALSGRGAAGAGHADEDGAGGLSGDGPQAEHRVG